MKTIYLPENYEWKEGLGLFEIKKNSESKIAKAIPIVSKIQKIVHSKTRATRVEIVLYYESFDGKKTKKEIFREEDIVNGSFMKKIPTLVIIEPKCRQRIVGIYQYIIQSQITEMKSEEMIEYEFGWNGNKFYWGRENEVINLQSLFYEATIKMAEILNYDNDSVNAIFLAAIHGIIKRVLIEAHIEHDFVTFIVGDSGVGKTELAKIFCEYLPDKKVVYTLGSDKKELQKIIQDCNDRTIVIDDFCKSESKRVEEKQLQTLSELIQGASDAGKLLIRDGSNKNDTNTIHIVSTSEKFVRNVSTINRCFLIKMKESIEDNLWKKIVAYRENDLIKVFMMSFTRFIENEYEDIIERCKSDYYIYQNKKYAFQRTEEKSKNRIINTMAVQLTIKKIVVDYFEKMKIDMNLICKINEILDGMIYSCIADLQSEIDTILKKKKEMYLLPILFDIITSKDNEYLLATTEEKYKKKYSKKKKLPYLGVCINSGYVSFSPKYMCELIAKKQGVEAISARELGKELRAYSLAYIDKEGKMSSKWHSKSRMYHVKVRELLELTNPDMDNWDVRYILKAYEKGC